MTIVPRSTVWPEQLPHNLTGGIRPMLLPNRPMLTIHYGGAGLWLDPDHSPTELRSIQAYAASARQPWECDYVINGQALIFEYAGGYRAARAQIQTERCASGLTPNRQALLAHRNGNRERHDPFRLEPTEAGAQFSTVTDKLSGSPGSSRCSSWKSRMRSRNRVKGCSGHFDRLGVRSRRNTSIRRS